MKQRVRRALQVPKTERYGLAALLLLCCAFWLAPTIWRMLQPHTAPDCTTPIALLPTAAEKTTAQVATASLNYFDPNTISFEALQQLGLSARTARSICNYRNKGGQFRQPTDLVKIYTLSRPDFERLLPFIRIAGHPQTAYTAPTAEKTTSAPTLFAFDPNTATEAQLCQLGLPPTVASNVVKYRAKGGQFHRKEDLLRIYGFPADQFATLAPYIQLAESTATAYTPKQATPVQAPTAVESIAPRPVTLDINQATLADWMGLPGIGAGWAKRILNFREKLGGFQSVAQVGETFGLPDSVFQDVKIMLALRTPIYRKIDLNQASVETIKGHPYFSEKQAKLIVAYREQHSGFQSISELADIHALRDAAWREKVQPYLTVGASTPFAHAAEVPK